LFLGLIAGAAAADTAAPTHAIQTIYGFTEGMLSEEPHMNNCVIDTFLAGWKGKKALSDMQAAISDKDVIHVADALDGMADALRMLPTAMEFCGATKNDVATLAADIKEIEGFKDLLSKMKTHLIFNSRAIITDVMAAESSLKAENYEDFGKHVGLALHRLALGKFHDSSADLLFSEHAEIKPALELVYGLTVGMLSNQRHLATCVTNGLTTVDDAKSSLATLKTALSDKSLLELADALDAAADTLRMIPATMGDCSATTQDVKDIRAALQEIDGFQDFLTKAKRHIALNSVGILADYAAAKNSYAAQDYEDAGEHLGMMLHKVAFGRFHSGVIV
jgi:hypothetical protein